ncbi:hypothetical protein BC628DRAFT_1335138 [Trametes gibbosa]|nr:hypothetical protein BC628DRAFT_1335138 [Trametes gibbosa]
MSIGITCTAHPDHAHWYSFTFANTETMNKFRAAYEEGYDLAEAHHIRQRMRMRIITDVLRKANIVNSKSELCMEIPVSTIWDILCQEARGASGKPVASTRARRACATFGIMAPPPTTTYAQKLYHSVKVIAQFVDSINCLQFDHRAERIAVGCDDGRFKVFDIRDDVVQVGKFRVANIAVTSLLWHPTEVNVLFIGYSDGGIMVCQLSDLQQTEYCLALFIFVNGDKFLSHHTFIMALCTTRYTDCSFCFVPR